MTPTTKFRGGVDLRVMEIPPNHKGLGEGYWLRWPELRMVLVQRGDTELADLLEEQIVRGVPIETKKLVV